MRRMMVLVVAMAAFLAVTAAPALADYPPDVIVIPGDSVEVADGIFIEVETNGTVAVTDGIFVEKFSTGGRPFSIAVKPPNSEVTMIVLVGGCDLKC